MMRTGLKLLGASLAAMALAACGGGGGKSTEYPFSRFVDGRLKQCKELYIAEPGCTFDTKTGEKITVVDDPGYRKSTDDLQYVQFSSSGKGSVYDSKGNRLGTLWVEDVKGYLGGTYATVGDGKTGTYVAGQTFYLGATGILYNSDAFSDKFGFAINKTKETLRRVPGGALASSSETVAVPNMFDSFYAANQTLIAGLSERFASLGLRSERAESLAKVLVSMKNVGGGERAQNAVISAATGGLTGESFSTAADLYLKGDKKAAQAEVQRLQAEIASRNEMTSAQVTSFLQDLMVGAQADAKTADAYAFVAESLAH